MSAEDGADMAVVILAVVVSLGILALVIYLIKSNEKNKNDKDG